jgi:hypothetical protein
VAQVAVREGVRGDLELDDDAIDFDEDANYKMVDTVIYYVASED